MLQAHSTQYNDHPHPPPPPQANKVNQTVFFKPIPEQPDALPDRMSNIKAEPFPDYPIDPMWTNEMYACFNPQIGRKIQCGKVAEDMECCNQQ